MSLHSKWRGWLLYIVRFSWLHDRHLPFSQLLPCHYKPCSSLLHGLLLTGVPTADFSARADHALGRIRVDEMHSEADRQLSRDWPAGYHKIMETLHNQTEATTGSSRLAEERQLSVWQVPLRRVELIDVTQFGCRGRQCKPVTG